LRSRALSAVAALVAAVLAGLASSSSAAGSRYLQTGIFDDGLILYNDPAFVFPLLKSAKTQTIRVNLWWGGTPVAVAKRKPRDPTDPDDPAYDWEPYDRAIRYSRAAEMGVLFSIVGTPPWANAGKGWNVAPTKIGDLFDFAKAAATRYNGRFKLRNGIVLSKVHRWLVWNEPNNPVFLKPQFVRTGGRWVMRSPKDYARMCNAVVRAIKSVPSSGKVACGGTGPRGNNIPGRLRASVSPIAFLRGMRSAGATGFDAYAHHPYYGARSETPFTPPPRGKRGQPTTAVTLGNFGVLVKELTRLYGNKRIWITEYGYQTLPQDRLFGVTYAQQAEYLRQAYRFARLHKRIDLFLWFLMRDDSNPNGWQSGFVTSTNKRKPSFSAYARINGG
jgi:Glycosyl hydrolase catalytic core